LGAYYLTPEQKLNLEFVPKKKGFPKVFLQSEAHSELAEVKKKQNQVHHVAQSPLPLYIQAHTTGF